MIITCPSCSARYVVDPAKIGSSGRTVKCAKCAHAWAQPAPTDEEMAGTPAAAPAPAAAPSDLPPDEEIVDSIRDRIDSAAQESDNGNGGSDDDFRSKFDDAYQDDTFRSDPDSAPRPLRRGSSSNLPVLHETPSRWPARLAWIALFVVVAGVVGGTIVFQDAITKSWPAAQKLYGLMGESAESMEKKLGVRSVQYTYPTPTALKIDGELVNLSKAPQNVPNLRVLFLDAGGKVVKRWTFPPRERRMLPDEVIKFSTLVQNPPADAKRIDVGLDIQ
tara:strand:- start:22808 stop:23635 length:828 start_codon:yes stop_codon:yes gene_type:complete